MTRGADPGNIVTPARGALEGRRGCLPAQREPRPLGRGGGQRVSAQFCGLALPPPL